jgi:hypothetical protein
MMNILKFTVADSDNDCSSSLEVGGYDGEEAR